MHDFLYIIPAHSRHPDHPRPRTVPTHRLQHRPKRWTREVLKLLIDQNLTVTALAKRIRTNRVIVSTAINKRSYPSVITKIEKTLGIPPR